MSATFRVGVFLVLAAGAALCNPITWTLSATFNDGGTAAGVFTFDSDTGKFSNWNVSTSGGNTSVFFPFDFTPANSSLSLNRVDPSGPTIAFVSDVTFPDAEAGTPENLILQATLVSPLTDALGAISINLLSGYTAECFDCGPARFFTSGTLTAVPGNQTSQTITFGALSNVTLGVAPFAISAPASSGLAVTFASTTPSVCTVSGSTITILAVGTCSITASQAGSANYAAATPVTQSFTVVASLAVTPTALSFQLPQGPLAQAQSLQIGGAAGTAWQATATTSTGGAWLSVSPGAGQIPASLTALVNSVNLTAGTYQGSITIQAPGATPPASNTIGVTLTVTPASGPSGQNQIVVTVAGASAPIPPNLRASFRILRTGILNFQPANS